jgi:uncharacterized protein YqgC (DUF456 family)
MEFLLYLIAVALFVAGVVCLVRRNFLMGIVLIILAFVVGPAGVSLLL